MLPKACVCACVCLCASEPCPRSNHHSSRFATTEGRLPQAIPCTKKQATQLPLLPALMATYWIMLKGAGPRRAQAQRVTHVLYMCKMEGDQMQVLEYSTLYETLKALGVHCVEYLDTISVSIPFLPRNFKDATTQCGTAMLHALQGGTEAAAREELIEWCCRFAMK